jgi:DNA repair exonuclease SbcCD nuclease subunit
MNVIPFEIGDVHLGRKFTNGVPLHRKGDRERMVMDDFKMRLATYDGPLLVQTGDLFDSFTVDEAIVLDVARTVRAAATAHPDSIYVFYRGNHDASKDTSKASSFDVFKELMQGLENVKVLTNVDVVIFEGQAFGFIPWHPFKSADELAQNLIDNWGGFQFEAVYGHWDVEGYGSAAHDFNMVPTKILSARTKVVKTGHVHKPTAFDRDGVRVTVIGSMQPYAHGEDPATTWYKTTSYADFNAYGPLEKEWCRNLNLRIVVKDGEVPEPINCLSFITKKATDKNDDEAPDLDVQIADFNMDNLFSQAMDARGVTSHVQELVSSKFKELRNTGA